MEVFATVSKRAVDGVNDINKKDKEPNERDIEAVIAQTRKHQHTGELAATSYLDSDVGLALLKNTIHKNILATAASRSAKPTLKIHANLDPDRRREMRDIMADYDLEMDESDGRDHAIARAATKCMAAIMDNDVLRLNSLKTSPSEIRVKHVGENPTVLINDGLIYDHNCLCYDGAGDSRDVARKGAFLAGLLNRDWSSGEVTPESRLLAGQYMQRFVKGGNVSSVCGRLAQDCDVKCRTIRSRNIHDISPRQMAMAMARSEAVIASGIIMYHPSVFLPGIRNGHLPYTRYTFTREGDGSEDRIIFRGPSDTQDPYVHKWSVYSAWILGDRRITVRHKGRVFYYEFNIKLAAMDHLIWSMFPVSTRCVKPCDRVLPQMSGSRVDTIYGFWYDTEHQDYNLLRKPSKINMMVARVAYCPREVTERVERLLMAQTNSFTSAYAIRAVNSQFNREVDGVPYSAMYAADASTVGFLASCLYELTYDARYMVTQTVGAVNQEITDLRERWDSVWVSRLYRSMFSSHANNKDMQYVDENGKVRIMASCKVGWLLQLANTFFKRNKFNTAKLRPLFLSAMSTFKFTDKSSFDRYGLEQACAQLHRFSSFNDYMDDSDDVSPDLEPLPGVLKDDLTLHPISVNDEDKFSKNSCLIDSFIVCMEDASSDTLSYVEVAARIARSRFLKMLSNSRHIVNCLRNDEPVPLKALHVLACEYGVQIIVAHANGGFSSVYGDVGPRIYMLYSDEHLIPCRPLYSMFPAFLDKINELYGNNKIYDDPILATDIEYRIAERVAYKYNEDADNLELCGDAYNDVFMLDTVFRSTASKIVFDPYGSFVKHKMVRKSFNWTLHTAIDMEHRDVRSYTGVTKPVAHDDPEFWNMAVKDKNFRFDLILFSSEEFEFTRALKPCLNLLRSNGTLAVKFKNFENTEENKTALRYMNEILSPVFASVSLVRPTNCNLLSEEIMLIFRGKDKGDCDFNDVILAHCKRIRMFTLYLRKSYDDCHRDFERTVYRVKKHIVEHMTLTTLESCVKPSEKSPKNFLEKPRNDDVSEILKTESLRLQKRGLKKSISSLLKKGRYLFSRFVSCAVPEIMDVHKLHDNDTVYITADQRQKNLQQVIELLGKLRSDNIQDTDVSDCDDEDAVVDDEASVETIKEIPDSMDNEVVDNAIEKQTERLADISCNMQSSDSVEMTKLVETENPETVALTGNIPINSEIVEVTKKERSQIIDCAKPVREQLSDSDKINYELSITEFVNYFSQVTEKIGFMCTESVRIFASFDIKDVKRAIEASDKDMIVIIGNKKIIPSCTTISDAYTHVWDVQDNVIMKRSFFEDSKRQIGLVIPEFDPYIAHLFVEKYGDKIQQYLPDYRLNITTIQAVAGAGKSHRMIENFKMGDVIVVPTQAARDEMRKRLLLNNNAFASLRDSYNMKMQNKDDEGAQNLIDSIDDVRTMCSLLLHPRRANILWVDEMTLHHRGAIYLGAYITKATSVICLGDAAQTHCFSRVDGYRFQHHRIDDKHIPVEKMTITRRCSIRIAKLAAYFYASTDVLGKERFSTYRKEKGDISFSRYSADRLKSVILNIPKGNSIAVISFTRSDKTLVKKILKAMPHVKVHTITEFQGSEADVVILVRTNTNNKATGLYTREDQLIVAATRARQQFIYLTNAMKDPMAKAINNVRISM